MNTKEVNALVHPMYKHIHDDRVTCAKCEAIGFRDCLKSEEVQILLSALENLYKHDADYITINHLGDVHHNKVMKDAKEALDKFGKFGQPKVDLDIKSEAYAIWRRLTDPNKPITEELAVGYLEEKLKNLK